MRLSSFGLLLLVAACASNPVAVHTDTVPMPNAQALALAPDERTEHTRAVLQMMGIAVDSSEALAQLEDGAPLSPFAPPPHYVDLARSELLMHAASAADAPQAMSMWLEAALLAQQAHLAFAQSSDGVFHHSSPLALQIGREALGQWIDLLQRAGRAPSSQRVATRSRGFQLTIDSRATDWDASLFDRFVSCQNMDISGFECRHRRAGIGLPLIGVTHEREDAKPLLAPYAHAWPVTAVLTANGENLRLSLFDPWQTETVTIDGGEVPLAADFTAPFAYQIQDSEVVEIADEGLFDPAAMEPLEGILMRQPYDPNRIPVLMIHGLWDSPVIWRNVTNDIWGDSTLRRSYQVWHYIYPSGSPILLLAQKLRQSLRELRERVDPERDDVATQDLVLACFSMGGLIGKTLVMDSGTAVYDTHFSKPLDRLDLSDEDRKTLEDTYFFEHSPWPTRAILLAVPHHGSEEADSWIGQLGSFLVALPKHVEEFAQRVVSRNSDALRDQGSLTRTSIDELSQDNPMLATLAALPILVPFHTVFGDAEDGDPLTDGIVNRDSACLDGAESEFMVASAHNVVSDCCCDAEIRRILHQHLILRNRARGDAAQPRGGESKRR